MAAFRKTIKGAARCPDTEVWIIEQAMRANYPLLDTYESAEVVMAAVSTYNTIRLAR